MFRPMMLILTLGLLSGCALGLEHVDIAYRPMAFAEPVPGADRVAVRILVSTGAPTDRERVGVKKNSYGIELGGIAPSRPVADIVGGAVATELGRRGFGGGPGGATVMVEVTRFYNDFKNGFVVAEAQSEVSLVATVRSPAGAIAYVRSVRANGDRDNLIIGTPNYAREALEQALANAVSDLVSDPAFIRALFAAAGALG